MSKFLNGLIGNWRSTVTGTGVGVTGGALFGFHTPEGKVNWLAVLFTLLGVLKGIVSKDSATGSQPGE